MKWLIVPLIASAMFVLVEDPPDATRQRYFLIGYAANQDDHVFTVGYDTCMTHYPNWVETENFLAKKYKLDHVHILAISEQSPYDRDSFIKPYKELR
jgi:hypothetical protein